MRAGHPARNDLLLSGILSLHMKILGEPLQAASGMANTSKRRVFDFYQLENRILLSGDTLDGAEVPGGEDVAAVLMAEVGTVVEHDATAGESASASQFIAADVSDRTRHMEAASEGTVNLDAALPLEIVFVDSGVQDSEGLLDGLRGESSNESQWLIIELAADQDGIDQISRTLEPLSGVNAVHILSHGTGTGIRLGTAQLNVDTGEAYAGQIAGWARSFDADADVLIYGCGLASTDDGRGLIESIAVLCDCDVAASDDPTGHEQLGGDWELEFQVGEVETRVAIGDAAQANWMSILDSPVGSETTVASTSAAESNAAVAMAASGDFVVVWEKDDGGSDGADVYFQRYDAGGTEQGTATRVNTTINGNQNLPSVAMKSDGGFVVVWDGNGDQSGQVDNDGIFMQQYDFQGNSQGGETLVNSNNKVESDAEIAMNADGDFVVVWSTKDSGTGSEFEIYLQRFDSSGTAQGSEIRANTTTDQDQFAPVVAMASDGSFVVAWEGRGDESGETDSHGVFFQMFDSSSVAQGNENRVNTTTADVQSDADIAINGNGDFLVAWTSGSVEVDGVLQGQIFHQLFDATGGSIGGEEMDTSELLGPYASPSVATTAADGFVLAFDGDGSAVVDDIYKIVYDAGGNQLSSVLVSTTDTTHSKADVGTASNGDSVIVWQTIDYQADPDADSILLQRYSSNAGPVITTGAIIVANPSYQLPTSPSGSLLFSNHDIVVWDGAFAVLFDSPAFSNDVMIDAIARSPSGNVLLSISTQTVVLGGVEFGSGDIVEYNTESGDTSLFLKGSLLANGPDSFGNTTSVFLSSNATPEPTAENVDALHVRSDGKILLSVEGTGGLDDGSGQRLSMNDSDIVLYDPIANSASILFDFSGLYLGDIDAISEQSNGLLTLSAGSNITLPNGDVFSRSDLFDFNHTGSAIDGLDPLEGRLNRDNPGADFMNSAGGSSSPNLNGVANADGGSTASVYVPEGQTMVTQITATSSAGATLSFSITGGADFDRFTLNSSTGELEFALSPDHETPGDSGGDNTYEVEVTVEDGNSASDSQLLLVTVTDVLPGIVTDADDATNEVVENAPVGTIVGVTAQALDDVDSYFLSDDDEGRFAIHATTGLVTVAVPLDRETDGGLRQIEVSATDGATIRSSFFSIAVSPVNEHDPVIISDGGGATASIAVQENATSVTSVVATDSDAPTDIMSYDIVGGADASKFTIDPVTGFLAFITAPDFETPTDAGGDNLYVVEVQASDGSGRTDSQLLSISVEDMYVAIASQQTQAFVGSSATIGHDTAGDDRLMLVTVSMANHGSTVVTDIANDGVSLSFVGAENYSVNSQNEVRIEMWALVAPALGVHDVTVNLSSPDVEGAFVGITIFSNVDQLDPYGVFASDGETTSTASVVASSAEDELVFNALAVETHSNYNLVPVSGQAQLWDLHTLALNFGAGIQDGAESVVSSWGFNNANDWVLATLPIRPTVTSNADPVITSDGGGEVVWLDVDEHNATAFVPPGSPDPEFPVTTIQATDSDLGQQLQYTIVGGDDFSQFRLDPTSGLLEFLTAPDRELPTDASQDAVYELAVQVTDGSGGSDSQLIFVTLNDVNEYSLGAVTDVDLALDEVAENAVTGTVTGLTALATDADATATVSYSLQNDAGGRFQIDSATGILLVANGNLLDRESSASHDVTVLASSSDGSQATSIFTIFLSDVDEYDLGSVVDNDPGTNQVAENAVTGTATGLTGLAIDADATATVTYTLQNDAGGRFQIDSGTAFVSVADGTLVDRESAVSHDVTVLASSSDGSQATGTFSILLVDVDEFDVGVVVDEDLTANEVTENTSIGTATGITALATDVDATTNAITYSLANDDGGRFSIDPLSGAVSTAGMINSETDGATRELTVRATSLDGSFSDQTFTVSIMDVDEFDLGPISDADNTVDAVDENAISNSVVGVTAFASDADAENNVVSYAMDDTAGGRFKVDEATGVLTVDDGSLINREIAASYLVSVRATSSDGSEQTRAFEIAINDVDEFAVTSTLDVDADADQVDENASVGTVVGVTASAFDADATTNEIFYSLDDNDGGRFTVDSVTGVLTVASEIDREADGPLRTIVIRSQSQDGSFTSASFVIAIGDVDEFDVEPGQDVDPVPNIVDENSPAGTVVGLTVVAEDADATATVAYSLDDDANGRFVIDSSTGQVTVMGDLDFESQASHGISVRSISSDGSESTQSFVIEVQDVNEPPVAVADVYERFEASDGLAPGVVGNDWDVDGDQLSAVLVNGPANGRLTLESDGSFVYTANAGFVGIDTFSYRATDGFLQSEPVEVRIEVIAPPPTNDVNDDSTDEPDLDLPLPLDGLIGLKMETNNAGDVAPEVQHKSHAGIISKDVLNWTSSRLLNVIDPLEAESQFAVGVSMGSLSQSRSPQEGIESAMLRELLEFDLEQAIVWQHWDALRDNFEGSPIIYVVGSAGSAAGVISVGYLLWIIRGSTAITVLTSSLPSWRMVDPAAILTAYRKSMDHDEDGVDGMLD